jgi:UDP-N-acetylglucosamine transferase subunit ALG13
VIEKLLNAGFKVIMAGEGDQKILLATAFPQLEMLHLDGYKLRYGSTKWGTVLKIILQIPKMLTTINKENKWLRKCIKEKHLDVIISDNRFGLHHASTINIFITHQLRIKTPFGKIADGLLQKLNYHYINRFDYCWVPDLEGEKNLAGKLSHTMHTPACEVIYTGLLSAIKKQELAVTNKLLLLLSGPEPQRTILENILISQLTCSSLPAILVRGLPAATHNISFSSLVTVYNYLPASRLQELINTSEIVICRSGYSTVMDLLPLGKKCIFIPTPGQAEQEYLAQYLAAKKYGCTVSQQHFELLPMIKKAEEQEAFSFSVTDNDQALKHAIALLSHALNKK